MRWRPLPAALAVIGFAGLLIAADWAMDGGGKYQMVRPDQAGVVRLDLSELGPSQVRFYRFLNSGNQEVMFLVGRDRLGGVQVAFDAAVTHYKRRRGFRHQGDWLVDNVCDTSVRLEEVNHSTGGCRPVPLKHRVEGNALILTEPDILAGWRYFR